jgi:hypothetical protein
VAVDALQMPWLVIPPTFSAFRDDAEDDGLPMNDATMGDGVSIILFFQCVSRVGDFDALCSKDVMKDET